MLGRINSPRNWPEDPQPTHAELRQIDKTLAAYGPDSDPRFIPSKDGRDTLRVAAGLEDAQAMALCEPIGMCCLL